MSFKLLGEWYSETPAYEDDECDCAKCQSIREIDRAFDANDAEYDGPPDSYYSAENQGGTSYNQGMRDAGRGHLI